MLTVVVAMVGFLKGTYTPAKLADHTTNSTVFGYETTETAIGWNITAERQQLISSLMTLGAIVASGSAGPLAGKLGRKQCLWIACLLCAISDILMMATKSIGGTQLIST